MTRNSNYSSAISWGWVSEYELWKHSHITTSLQGPVKKSKSNQRTAYVACFWPLSQIFHQESKLLKPLDFRPEDDLTSVVRDAREPKSERGSPAEREKVTSNNNEKQRPAVECLNGRRVNWPTRGNKAGLQFLRLVSRDGYQNPVLNCPQCEIMKDCSINKLWHYRFCFRYWRN